MTRKIIIAAIAIVSAIANSPANAAEGDADRGQRAFRTCAACHSLAPQRHMTGPSLAGLWNRKAGTAPGFTRYSTSIKSADVVWTDSTLDQWLRDPQHFIPGNTMIFPGIEESQSRADLLAFLKEATAAGARQSAQQGPMGGMTGGGAVPNLKNVEALRRVQAILYCRDTYRVTTADGKTRDFWERNLRFKTDSSEDGPEKGAPAIVGAGMVGDRASIIFAEPAEIGAFVEQKC